VTFPAAILAAILFLGMAAFQLSLALGAPLGAHTSSAANTTTC
jgi:hypothetical protein